MKIHPQGREHLKAMLPICKTNECGHYGVRVDSTGCLLHPISPCRIANHLLQGGGCFDEQNPQFPPLEPPA